MQPIIKKLPPSGYSLLRWQVSDKGIIEAFPKDQNYFYLKSYCLENARVLSKWNCGTDSVSLSELLSIKCTILYHLGLEKLKTILQEQRRAFFNDKSFLEAVQSDLKGFELINVFVSYEEMQEARLILFDPKNRKVRKYKKTLTNEKVLKNNIIYK